MFAVENLTKIQIFAIWIIPIIFAITVHEFAHGFIAKIFGDKTAENVGRLTLNPVKHIDLFGTLIVPILLLMIGGMAFGWAKPVPVNYFNLRHPRRDMVFVSMAGPFANLLMAVFWAIIAKIGMLVVSNGYPGLLALIYMGEAGILMNSFLAVFNLLPIPPLDGGQILLQSLPNKLKMKILMMQPFGMMLIFAMVAMGVFGLVVQPVASFIDILIAKVFHLM